MRILKILTIVLSSIFLLVIFLSFATFMIVKHAKISKLVEQEIEKELGINVTIKDFKYSPLLTHIYAEGITVNNPEGFDEKELAYINSIHLVWDPLGMVVLKKPNIYLVSLDLERLNIIKNKLGKVNIKELMPVKDSVDAIKDEAQFSFDVFVLSIGQVSYTEYTHKGKKAHIYTIGIKDRAFVHLSDENEVIMLVIHSAIQNTDIGKLVNLTFTPILSGVSDTVDAVWGTAKTGTKSFFEIASMPFHIIFGR